MPISSLPKSTLRAITSTLALSDAVSVVKELVDNALDAKATTIAIEISANTLDVIQVKDNGTGIGVEDRQLVCKRGCTSKITTIEDLERLGGSSLGFRGEALASVADLSESVTLTTRVDGETAGSMLKYGPTGALVSCSSTSHPVGSTIRVKTFLKSIPVRKQTALKNASKTLAAIKTLLQTYAFARGTVRFSFKVLKGKNEKANWSYSPVDSVDKLRDIATRIIGKDVAARCEITTKAKPENGDNRSKGEDCSVVALLATIDDDATILNNTGHYISIDGRPVTAARGTIKEVVQLYRHYVRKCAALVKHLPASFDPLLVMHIALPRGSYDVNVEPAKDEVMFMNPKSVLITIEALFKDHYGEQSQLNTEAISNIKAPNTPYRSSPFDLLLAKRPSASIEFVKHPHQLSPGTLSPQQQHNVHDWNESLNAERITSDLPRNDATAIPAPPQKDRIVQAIVHRAHSNMYGFNEDEEMPPPSPSLDSRDGDHDFEEVGNDLGRNPWSLAKLNAPARYPSKVNPSTPSMNQQLGSLTSTYSERDRVPSTPQASTHRQSLGLGLQLPSPVTSPHCPQQFQNPGPPKRPWPSRQERDESAEPESEHDLMTNTPNTHAQSVVRSLNGWAKPVLPRTELPSFKRALGVHDKDGRFEQTRDEDLSQLPTSRAQSSHVQSSLNIASHAHPQQAGSVGRTFRTPLLSSPANTGGNARGTSQVAPSVMPGSQQTSLKLLQSQNPELDQIMDFERRKKATNVQQRKSFGKAAGHSMNIAQLAQLQRSTGQASDDDLGSTNVPGYQDHAHDLRNQASAVTFGDRFEKSTSGHDASPKPSPHRNRYLAAAKALTRTQPDHSDVEVDDFDSSCFAETTEDSHEIPRMPEDDARAYLMRHRSQTENANAGVLSRTGLKIRRTRTLKLPLESVPTDMMLHDVVAQVESNVQLYAEEAPGNDKYSTTGKNDFVVWTSAMTNVLSLQGELTTLVQTIYRARVGGELISPNLELDLRRLIKNHCDNT